MHCGFPDMNAQQSRIVHLARNAMIGASVAISLSLGVAYVSYQRYQTDEKRQAENLRHERAAKRKLDELNDDIVQAGLARTDFERLRAEGSLGELVKTRLLDGIEQALHPFGEAVAEYKLEGLREFSEPALSRLSRHKFNQHRLELTLKPVHELEFMDIWFALSEGRSGIAPIESCELLRKDGSGTGSSGGGSTAAGKAKEATSGSGSSSGEEREVTRPRVSRLEAQCVLIAYTIRFDAQAGALAATAPMPGASK